MDGRKKDRGALSSSGTLCDARLAFVHLRTSHLLIPSLQLDVQSMIDNENASPITDHLEEIL
jgi:hypothetical protein